MSCASCLAGCLLVLVNIIFMLIGLALIAAGAILKWGNSLFMQYLSPILRGIFAMLPSGDSGMDQDMQEFIFNLLEVLSTVSTVLLLFGVVLFLISICGMCGVCCKTKYLLIPYIGITSLMFVVVLGFLVWLAVSRGTLKDLVTSELTKWIQNDYKGFGEINFGSIFWDTLNTLFGCCGVTNGTDFSNAPGWNRYFNTSSVAYNYNVTLIYPVSCCKMHNFKPESINCTWNPTLNNSNYAIGCWSKVNMLYDEYTGYALAGLGGICGFLIILIALTVLVTYGLKKTSVDPS